MTQQVAGVDLQAVQEIHQIIDQLLKSVRAGVRTLTVTALIIGDDATEIGKPAELVLKVQLGSREAMHEHERMTLTFVVVSGLDVQIADEVSRVHALGSKIRELPVR